MYDATGVGRDFKAGLEESGIVPVVVDLSACTQVTNFRGQKAALYYDPSRGMEDNDPSGGQGRSYKDPSLGQTWREEWRAGGRDSSAATVGLTGMPPVWAAEIAAHGHYFYGSDDDRYGRSSSPSAAWFTDTSAAGGRLGQH